MSNTTEKSTVINKEAVKNKLKHFYITLADANNISLEETLKSFIRVPKLAAFVEDYGMSVGGAYADDEEMKEDYALDYEMSMIVGNDLFHRFTIPPTTAYVSHDTHCGLMLEWIPEKSIYINSFDEYVRLYQSFIDYLESDVRGLDCKMMDMLDDAEFKICCSVLYGDMNVIETNAPYIREKKKTPLFTEDNFKSPYMTIITHEGYFISETGGLFSPSYNVNVFNEIDEITDISQILDNFS